MWDTEIWMLPSILLINSNWSKQILHYRFQHMNAAKKYAQSLGYPGAR